MFCPENWLMFINHSYFDISMSIYNLFSQRTNKLSILTILIYQCFYSIYFKFSSFIIIRYTYKLFGNNSETSTYVGKITHIYRGCDFLWIFDNYKLLCIYQQIQYHTVLTIYIIINFC